MAKTDFISQLQDLGFTPQIPVSDRVYIEWTVPVGKNIGKRVLLGFFISDDFPLNCPTGPHFLPIDEGWIEHPQNVHDQHTVPFGQGWSSYPTDIDQNYYATKWRYWSRPCPTWGQGDRTVKYYLAHIKNIMMTV